MSKAWIRQKRPEFLRDVMRDFCRASRELELQFRDFDDYGRLDFGTLRDLLGEERNKGLLWRLKDTAHHLFRNDRGLRMEGKFLDWALGYIFHETIKLKEDAYQQRTYGPWFREMRAGELSKAEKVVSQDLYQVVLQTRQSIQREAKRIRFILFHVRRLFPAYLTEHGNNALLARYIFEENELVREVFGGGYQNLIEALYGGESERLYVLASQSLRMGGWMDKASQAVSEAVKLGPKSRSVLQEKEIVDNWTKKLHV